ncbi:sensor domain-containing diguanylate cyclase [Alkalihalobacterium elongatum]|uniref:sensor domain-containing diguanylate cyclase n=1 Tax=Alkalihalobacterium elongatum TaxID=2675466 RepID=UPI001C1FD691|nr:diguanylate cyclase [Alkalihalobacterium elongatum]
MSNEILANISKGDDLFQLIAEYSSDMITVHDLKGRYLYVSPAGEEILQYKSEELVGKDSYLFIHVEDHETARHNHEMLLKTGYVVSTYRIRRKDGEYIWFESSIKSLSGKVAGELVELGEPHLIVISRNITERKLVEKKLKEVEELFQIITEYSRDMITIHNAAGEYLFVSAAVKEMLQYDDQELIGKSGYVFIHPEDHKIVRQNHELMMITGAGVSTYRIQRKDGKYIWFESTVRSLPRREPEDPQLIVMSRDITKRKIEEQKLQEVNEKLQNLSTKDGLTAIGNRRYFDERLIKEWKRAIRYSSPITLLMIDIDYFKPYNDTYGHQKGDDALKHVAKAIKDVLKRPIDVVCRYGGEEFSVILPDTDEMGGKHVAENIRLTIEALKIPHSGSLISKFLTISIGTATIIPPMASDPKLLIKAADRALYEAKEAGRNQVQTIKP